MSATIAAAPATTTDPALQQLLMRFAGALNRRRTYAAAHPMVVAAEDQLHESVTALVSTRPTFTIGVMKADLLIDGEAFVTRGAYARELATRLHRRGVGAITLQAGVPQPQLRELLAWLATETATEADAAADAPPVLGSIAVTRVAYDQLALGDVDRAVATSAAQLWRALAQIAGAGAGGRTAAGSDVSDADASTAQREAVLTTLGAIIGDTDVARRTAFAFMELTAQGSAAGADVRARLGEQLHRTLELLGADAFAAMLRAVGEREVQQRFTSQVVEMLPMGAVGQWLDIAAQAQERPLAPGMRRLVSRLAFLAHAQPVALSDGVVRSTAQSFVRGPALSASQAAAQLALLDRIAAHDGPDAGAGTSVSSHSATIEASRVVKMALEIDATGDDALAAAESLVAAGLGPDLLRWIEQAGDTSAARRLLHVATSDTAIRQLLLTEPVDRLQARALLERLDASSTTTLLDILEAAEARGTRMIVRQRLSEFGEAIVPVLTERLDRAPWYLVRNILTVLHEIAEAHGGTATGVAPMSALLDHAQVQVRTEAFRLLLLNARSRDAAIRRALRDDNERMVVLALQALSDAPDGQAELSPTIVTELMAMVDAGRQNDPVRARMVRTLAQTRGDAVRDWLIGHVVKRSRILRRVTLNEPTQTAVAALQVLQRRYGTDPSVEPLIAMARRQGYDRRWLPRDANGTPEQVA